MNELKSIIAKNISELRQKENLTQLELAEKLNYSDKAVSKWERGESMPDITILAKISELFGVTLDYLIREEHPQTTVQDDNEKSHLSASEVTKKIKNKITNRIIITCISVLLVWFVATIVFVVLDIFMSDTYIHCITYAYAIPASAIVWLVFNSVWFNVKRNYFIVSLLMWSLIGSIYITLYLLGINMWQLFLLGIPGQTIILLWSLLSFKSSKK